MITFNGFEPGETKSSTLRIKKGDNGHSIVKMSTTRRGHNFSFTYAVTCQCGQKYTGRTTMRPIYAHEQHVKKASMK